MLMIATFSIVTFLFDILMLISLLFLLKLDLLALFDVVLVIVLYEELL